MDKSICQRCFKERLRIQSWNDCDEARWKQGKVFCVAKSETVKNKQVPDGCKYALEHVVSEGKHAK
jgi:hypothetical protein